MSVVFGEIVCRQKKKKSSAGSQSFLYWKACREEHWDAGDAVHPRWPEARNAEWQDMKTTFQGFWGSKKKKSGQVLWNFFFEEGWCKNIV